MRRWGAETAEREHTHQRKQKKEHPLSMSPQIMGTVPAETRRVAWAAYPTGSLAMRLRDERDGLSQDEQFRALFPSRGQPAEAPWRFALVVVLQCVEGLTDQQAAEAVRGRIDWKDALGVDLSDPGFDASVLSACRDRLVAGQAETVLLDVLRERWTQRGWLKAGGTQRTASTLVLARVRSLSNLEGVGETLRAALNDLARLSPDWLVSHISREWCERSSHRVENARFPKADSQRTALAEHIGADGVQWGAALPGADAPAGGSEVERVHVLRQV